MIYAIIRQQLYCCIDLNVYLATSGTVIPPCYKKVCGVNQSQVKTNNKYWMYILFLLQCFQQLLRGIKQF